VYQVEETNLSTYSISSINDIHLRSGKVLSKDTPLVIEEIEREIRRKNGISIVEERSDSQDNQDLIHLFQKGYLFNNLNLLLNMIS
jgi:hypothetical protein